MPMQRDVCPLLLVLPNGRRAEYIAGARPARYTIDGQPTAIDVTIPDDLVASGWYWSGSFLYQPWPERPDGPGVGISTGTFGLPGVFDAARRLDAMRADVQTAMAAKPKKNAKKTKPPAQPATAVQMEMKL